MSALERADVSPLPKCAERYECPHTHRLSALCSELQRAAGDQPFYLACSKVEQVLGVDRMTAWRRLKLLVADGVLRVAETHTKTKATRYRYEPDDE